VRTDVLIVGGGLSGLSLAAQLNAAGRDYLLVEASDRLGGRICSQKVGDDSYDLGPSWIWPGQLRVADLIAALGLRVFDQHASGRLVVQETDGSVRRDLDFATMAGSLRLDGGMIGLIEGLAARLPSDRIRTSHRVTHLERTPDGVRATIVGETNIEVDAQHVALALPPRLAASAVVFAPTLSPDQMSAMRQVPTWMAGHAKVLAVYDRPFWRDAGLSGDGMSRRGPLIEIHDASPCSGRAGALFGFVGISAADRLGQSDKLLAAAVDQLATMYGPEAGSPTDVLFRDWATAPLTATTDDRVPLTHHPVYGTAHELLALWDGRLHLASTEMAATDGGLLEGALVAATAALGTISARIV
jgi:monoamine oxidase